MADLYKHLTSIPAAFMAIRQKPDDDGELVRKLLKQRVEEEKLLQRIPQGPGGASSSRSTLSRQRLNPHP